ncbi:MAG TPA: complex I NDUFA9 subunit family protein [Kiloniellales bacterium]|nr:complex I NDUFA9 subunit family protein [Kiloniellales bacterium]
MPFERSVTVFGGSGFIGRYVVARLAAQGWTVRVAVRRPRDAIFLKPLGDVAQIVPLPCNIGSAAEVRRVLHGSDAAVNLVGILQSQGRQAFDSVHIEGARNIAEAAAAEGITKLVHVSALGADSASPSDYARSKGIAEEKLRELLPGAVILRPSIVFGPEDSFFNRFASMARFSPFLPLIGGGTTRFQPVYVGDVAEAAVTCLTVRDCSGRTFELGGPRVYSFKELMQLMLETIERKRLLITLPWGIASFLGSIFQRLPNAPLTRDQVEQLKRDNIIQGDLPGLSDLGILPHSVEVIIPTYLDRYRRSGRSTTRLSPGTG